MTLVILVYVWKHNGSRCLLFLFLRKVHRNHLEITLLLTRAYSPAAPKLLDFFRCFSIRAYTSSMRRTHIVISICFNANYCAFNAPFFCVCTLEYMYSGRIADDDDDDSSSKQLDVKLRDPMSMRSTGDSAKLLNNWNCALYSIIEG